ncbi:MAG: hypothetical protein OXG90_01775, partial [Gammaproteobacteria bacterium]|nr:hypothetical protein [Gammaproteobacteria bacterium]
RPLLSDLDSPRLLAWAILRHTPGKTQHSLSCLTIISHWTSLKVDLRDTIDGKFWTWFQIIDGVFPI